MKRINKCSVGICLDKRKMSPVEFGIEKFTGDAHHVFMVVDNTFSGEMVIEAHIHTGVHIRPLSDYKDGVVLIAEPTFLSLEEESLILEEILEHDGEKYDTKNVFSHIFRTKWDSPDGWTCSELVAHGYSPILRFLAKDSKRVSPNDILRYVTFINYLKNYGMSPFNLYMIEEVYKDVEF